MKKIYPKCRDGSKSFVTADGKWLPCCQVNVIQDDYKKSILNTDSFYIKNQKDMKFHELDLFLLWLDKIESDFNSGLYACKYTCSKPPLQETKINNKDEKWLEEFTYITNEKELQDFLDSTHNG